MNTPSWRRPAVLGLLSITLLAELGVAVLNVSAMPVYLTDKELGRGYEPVVGGFVMMVFMLTEALLKSYFGHLADKYGRFSMVLAAPLLWLLSPLLTLWVPESWGNGAIVAIAGLRVLDGAAAAMLWPAIYAAAAEAVPDEKRGEAISLLNVCFMVGLALGLPFGGVVNSLTQSLEASFYLASALFAVTALVALFVGRKYLVTKKPDYPEYGEPGILDLLACVRHIPGVLLMAFVTFFGVGLPFFVIKLFAQKELGLSEAAFGTLVLPAALAMAAMSFPLGKLGEQIGRTRAVRVGLLLCSVGMWMVALGAWLPLFKTLVSIALAGTVVGCGFLLAIPAWYANVSGLNPARAGSYLGAVMAAQGIGTIIGLVLGSWLYGMNSYWPFIGSSVAVSAGLALSFVFLRVESNGSADP